MSIPCYCSTCLDVIGVESDSDTLNRTFTENFDSTLDVPCPGRGNHARPTRTESIRLFGLLKRVTHSYPETKTTSSWEEYVGPPNLFALWCAIVFGTKRYPNGSYAGVLVKDNWAWWDLRTGFYGRGIDELRRT